MPTSRPVASSALRGFLASEAAGGVLMIAAAALATVVANSPPYPAYQAAPHAPLGPELTEVIKRCTRGECSSTRTSL